MGVGEEMGTLEMQESGTRVRPFDEVGTSGLEMYSGFVQAAYDAELYWPAAGTIYSRIRRSDPEIGGIVRPAFTALSRGIKLEWQTPDEPSDDDKLATEYGMQVLEDMEGGPDLLVETIAGYVPFMGWGWWEEVWGVRNPGWRPPDPDDEWRSSYDDGLPAIRRLAWRDHASFEKWDADERTGRVRGFVQRDYPNDAVVIPRNKSLHLTFGDPVNPEGLSPLEAVWRLERLKAGFETVMGLGYEHAAGYAKFQTAAALSADDKAAIANAARAIMTPQKGNYIMLPGHVTADIMDGNFAAAGTLLEVVRYYGLLKLQVFAMQWAAVATTAGTGALAAHSDSSEMGLILYNAMWEGFAHQIDQQLGRRLFEHPQVKAAFPGMTRRPRLVALPVEKAIPLNLLSQFVAQIAPIVPMDDDDFIAIRRKSGFLPESLPENTRAEIRDTSEEGDEVEEEGVDEVDEVDEEEEVVAPEEGEEEDAGLMYRAVGELLSELRASIVGAPTGGADGH